jgi:hypothetical protein
MTTVEAKKRTTSDGNRRLLGARRAPVAVNKRAATTKTTRTKTSPTTAEAKKQATAPPFERTPSPRAVGSSDESAILVTIPDQMSSEEEEAIGDQSTSIQDSEETADPTYAPGFLIRRHLARPINFQKPVRHFCMRQRSTSALSCSPNHFFPTHTGVTESESESDSSNDSFDARIVQHRCGKEARPSSCSIARENESERPER